jgi:hypothetical protein
VDSSFKDLNGRIGRVILAALYAADADDLEPVTGLWGHRLMETL